MKIAAIAISFGIKTGAWIALGVLVVAMWHDVFLK